jgi:hypothetical protein
MHREDQTYAMAKTVGLPVAMATLLLERENYHAWRATTYS